MTLDLVVVGLGYVGLPLARQAVACGLGTAGFDTSEKVVSGLNSGRSHVGDVSDMELSSMVDGGFTASCSPEIFRSADAIVICVPTPLADNGGPDLRAVEAAAASVGSHMGAGALVVLESTTYPGTTDGPVREILERESGLVAGKDFALAFSPERIDPGNHEFGVANTPKVVGGLTAACRDRAMALYERFVDTVVPAAGLREAETAKLLENTYRHVNIALMNEMARLCYDLNIDVWDVIRLASTKPFGFQAFYPGPGVGGHCIPIDPNYLAYQVRAQLGHPFRFVELAQEINASMPGYVAGRVQNWLNEDRVSMKGSTVVLLGVSYKPNIADQRESPAIALSASLRRLGASVQYHDPFVSVFHAEGVPRVEGDLLDAVRSADVTVLVQGHAAYDVDALSAAAQRFFDTRGVAHGPSVERL